MFTNNADELTAILGQLYRLNGKGAPPVFTTKGVALQQIAYEAGRLKNGSYGTFPAYTSEGQLLDDIATLLSGATAGGGLTPVNTIVLTVGTPGEITIASGAPTGTVTVKQYATFQTFDFAITAASAWSIDILYSPAVARPRDDGFMEHDLTNASVWLYNSGPGGLAVRRTSGPVTFNRNDQMVYAI